jgi:hypothetical protein
MNPTTGPGHGLNIHPPLWTAQARPLENTSRRQIPYAQLVQLHQDVAQELADLPEDGAIHLQVIDQPT